MSHHRGSRIAMLGTLLIWATNAAALSPADKCEADKLKRAALYSACRLKAESKAIKKGEAPDYTKCDTKFGEKWTNAETAGAGQCPTNGDQTEVQEQITADADFIALKLTGVRFVDNGDGTVTDIETGLMWEKTDDLGGIHDKDNLYRWCVDAAPADGTCDNGGAPDGTAFTTFLVTLNSHTSADGTTISGCFAGHCDWRLPTIAELQTILLAPFPCGTSPCIDPIFGPPLAVGYWSATTNPNVPQQLVWAVGFNDGVVGNVNKTDNYYVRAVRGGS